MCELQVEGRRVYITGNTFAIKGKLRDAGAKWDADRKAWWVGSGKKADIEAVIGSPVANAAAPVDRPSQGEDQVVAGKVTYKGKTYFAAGRVERGRTHYDDRVENICSRDGGRILLVFTDGSSTFWADRTVVQTVKNYDKPQTIGGLKRFALSAKRLADDGHNPPVPGCQDCRNLGHMCRQCEFDN